MMNRRQLLAGGMGFAALSLSACARIPDEPIPSGLRLASGMRVPEEVVRMYAAMPEERFPVPAVNFNRLDPRYYRDVVDDPTGERAGTIVVDTTNRYLYLTLGDGKAVRYGVGIGRDGFTWSGRGYIAYKRKWPTWTPPSEMIEREPELEEYRNGMEPGLNNPLGARALYIFQDGRDTLYRLHGNPDESSIGKAVSSGCVRLINQDVIDLFNRVPDGTPIKVI